MRATKPADFFFGVEAGFFDLGPRHASRMNQFGVIVVAEDIRERLRGSRLRLDVRMRVDQANRIEFGEEPLAELGSDILAISDCGFRIAD